MTSTAHSRLPGPRGLPLLGNLLDFPPERFHLVLEEWAERYGELFQIAWGRTPALVITQKELVLDVLRRRPDDFRRWSSMAPILSELGGHGVFNAEGEDWRRQRKLLMPAFGKRALEGVYPLLLEVTSRLERKWSRRGAEPFDVHADLLSFTTDFTTLMAFGYDLNSLEQGDALSVHLRKLLPSVIRRLRAPFPYWRYIPVPEERATDRAVAHVKRELIRIIRAREAEAEKGSTLLDRLIEAHRGSEGAARFNDDELVGNLLTLLIAGEDTTANTLAWMLHYAAQRPEIWATMRAEADSALADGAPSSALALAPLRYTSAVFKETLRLRSPAPVLVQEAVADTTIGDIPVRQGQLVMLLTRRVGMVDARLSEPRAFKPERWLDGELASTGPGSLAETLLAFGSGPRLCPGRTLSEIEALTVMSMLCRRFDLVSPQAPVPVSERYAFTMEPHGLLLGIEPRDSRAAL